MATLTTDDVLSYLKNNPEFIEDWVLNRSPEGFLKNVTSKQNSVAPSISICKTVKRKAWGMVKNTVTTNKFQKYLEGQRVERNLVSIREKLASKNLDGKDLLMELIRDIASELDVNILTHKILQNVLFLTQSDRGSLFLVRGMKTGKCLLSKLFDVTETSTLEQSISNIESEIKVPFGRGISGFVAETQQTVNIKDAYEDSRFNRDVDKKTGYKTRSILCMPICNADGETVGVAQIINKLSGNGEYNSDDESVFKTYLTFCGIGISNAELFEMSVQEFKRNQLLLNLARGVFQEQTSMERLIRMVMTDAQDLLKCERSCVYLVDNSLLKHDATETTGDKNVEVKAVALKDVKFSKAFELFEHEKGNIHIPSAAEIASSKIAEIAKHVVASRQSINIDDIQLDGRFGKGPIVDDKGFQTRSILCTPVFDQDGQIIAVTQGINKLFGKVFNETDENIIEAFSIFTGLGIHNCNMYEAACRLMAKQKVALEVLSFHATSSDEEAHNLAVAMVPNVHEWQLYEFSFDDMKHTEYETTQATLALFTELNVMEKFNVDIKVLCKWILTVKKNYRPVTYHNWRHAFNVAQTIFTMIYTGDLKQYFSDLEVFALITACLCHDLDHRGTNNAFQVKAESPLAVLYSTSVMEHHHFDHCIMILNSEGNNIFQSLDEVRYKEAIECVEHAILSTDLALYFKKRGEFKVVVESGETDFGTDPVKKDLMKAMMMTACDVSAICKPWLIQRSVAELVYGEFFEQGDIEKTQFGTNPIAMMDRGKIEELPKMQVGFIDAICTPVYQLFADMSEPLRPLLDGVLSNRSNWQNVSDSYKIMSDQEVKDAQIKDRRYSSASPNSQTETVAVESEHSTSPASKPQMTVKNTVNSYKPTVLNKSSKKDKIGRKKLRKSNSSKSEICTIL